MRSPAEIETEREAKLAFAEAGRRYEEALSPDTPTERVAAQVIQAAPERSSLRISREQR